MLSLPMREPDQRIVFLRDKEVGDEQKFHIRIWKVSFKIGFDTCYAPPNLAKEVNSAIKASQYLYYRYRSWL